MFAAHMPHALVQNRFRYGIGLVALAMRLLTRSLCALRGHQMVCHFEPDRLALKCLACGATTPGWKIDVNPAFRLRSAPPVRTLPGRPRKKAA